MHKLTVEDLDHSISKSEEEEEEEEKNNGENKANSS
jgi:hypothetical protein